MRATAFASNGGWLLLVWVATLAVSRSGLRLKNYSELWRRADGERRGSPHDTPPRGLRTRNKTGGRNHNRSDVLGADQNGIVKIEASGAVVNCNRLADHMLGGPRMQRQSLRARHQQKCENGQRCRLEDRVPHSVHCFIDAD
jgi:hypothetical protein